ncbi:MAG: hypothetical protein ACFFDY_10035 [Candidatus Thorarchaeota archaeon]
MDIELIPKKKIRADDYIVITLAISYLLFAIVFSLGALLGVIIYPFVSLAVFSILKIKDGLDKNNNNGFRNINKILLGIILFTFSIIFLNWMLSRPGVTSSVIMVLATYPIMLVGFAGIIKGLMIDLYKSNHRVLNIIVGLITVVISLIVFSSAAENFLLNIVVLSITILLNIFSRAALYLSEYGLSLIHIKNFRLFFYIISDYMLYVERDGNVILAKME